MKFQVKREACLKQFHLIAGIVERKQTIPILSNVLLDIATDRMILTATDLEIEFKAVINLDGEAQESGKLTVSARKIYDIWRSLPEGALVNCNLTEAGFLELESDGSVFSLSVIGFENFPKTSEDLQPDQTLKFQVAPDLLSNTFSKTAFSIANNDVRPSLNGLLLEVGQETIRCVATDGHRLAMGEESIEAENQEQAIKVIIPRKGVFEVLKLLELVDEEVEVSVTDRSFSVSSSDYTLVTKLIGGDFPDYMGAVPSSSDNLIVVDLSQFKASLQRVSILSNEKNKVIQMTLEDEAMYITANNSQGEQASESITLQEESKVTGKLEKSFNVGYLLDILNVFSTDKVYLFFSSSVDAGALIREHDEEDNSLYIVMPMRV